MIEQILDELVEIEADAWSYLKNGNLHAGIKEVEKIDGLLVELRAALVQAGVIGTGR